MAVSQDYVFRKLLMGIVSVMVAAVSCIEDKPSL